MGNSDSIEKLHTVAFYNLENYFDTINDPYALDDDFTPKGFKKWTLKKFKKKTKKLAKAIANIGRMDTHKPPVLIGIAEIENSKVVQKLLQAEPLEEINYDFVHFDSPDERGIDTGLIYHKSYFSVDKAESLPLLINSQSGVRDLTRDILYVQGKLNGEEVHVFVNHWPSRRDGADLTSYKREAAAKVILQKIEALKNEGVNCIVMGDFNDGPDSKSISLLMASGYFINPMKNLLTPISGSANYKGEWSLFDQILISHSFLNPGIGTHSFKKAEIFNPKLLKEWKGKYKGNPFRTYAGPRYLGGYSDHFPVYILFQQH